jgi:hypothetical protein
MPQWAWFVIVTLAVVALLYLVGIRFDVNVS